MVACAAAHFIDNLRCLMLVIDKTNIKRTRGKLVYITKSKRPVNRTADALIRKWGNRFQLKRTNCAVRRYKAITS